MNILITGAAGFIGSHLAQRLAKEGHQVSGLDNYSDYYDPKLKALNAEALKGDGIEVHRVDLWRDDLEGPLENIEAVFHAAAQPGNSATTPFETYLQNNLIATQRLAETAMRSKSLKVFVNVATSSVYGLNATDAEDQAPQPISHYGVTKLAAEQLVLAYCRDKGFPACSVRLFSVYGPRERPDKLYPKLIRSILTDTPFPLYEGSREHSRSFTFVEDAVEGFVRVLEHAERCRGEIINIGSDIEITTGQGMEMIEDIMGKQARYEHLPQRPGDQLRTNANINKARELLNYEPKTKPEDGLRKEVEWYRTEIFEKGIGN